MTKVFTRTWAPGGMNTIALGHLLLQEMQAAGVPVVGVLWPMGVTSGVLESTYDEVFEELTFTWRE